MIIIKIKINLIKKNVQYAYKNTKQVRKKSRRCHVWRNIIFIATALKSGSKLKMNAHYVKK